MKTLKIQTLTFAVALFAAFSIFFVAPVKANDCTETNTTLAGVVTRFKTGRDNITRIEPVAGIAIKAVHAGTLLDSAVALTDSTGNYVLEGLAPCTQYYVYQDKSSTTNANYTGASVWTDPGQILGNTASNPFILYFRIYQF